MNQEQKIMKMWKLGFPTVEDIANTLDISDDEVFDVLEQRGEL